MNVSLSTWTSNICVFLFSVLAYSQEPEIVNRIYLIGDTGNSNEAVSLITSLSEKTANKDFKQSIIFLGDNIWPKGLPSNSNTLGSQSEQIINNQLNALSSFDGDIIFLPGEKDWADGAKEGWKSILRLQNHLDSSDLKSVKLVPRSGCPGPEVIEIGKDILLVIIDTQWLFHSNSKPGIDSDCSSKDPAELLFNVRDILVKNSNKIIVVATHHPVFSHGERSKKLLTSTQDLNHPFYKAISAQFAKILQLHPNTIHVSAHDNSLQYIQDDEIHYIISGTGSASSKVSSGSGTVFSSSKKGFAYLDFHSNNLVNLTFEDERRNEIFRQLLFHKKETKLLLNENQEVEIKDSLVRVAASFKYDKNKKSYWLLGKNYRDVWKTEISVRVFDIGKERGGLAILKKGGGQQTNSLRLEAADGKQYVLRSIEKYPERAAIPEILLETFAADLIKDQISSAHPYGAFVVPKLANATGLYHTNPELVWIPDDPRFGVYKEDFANGLYLYEERPAGKKWDDYESFGKPKDIISTSDLIEKLAKDNDHSVDQHWVVKSRLFDIWLGDWDRHDDQWRWAEFDNGKGNFYRPIPRDRDQAFFINNGLIMSIVKRKWVEPKFQGFDHYIKNPSGFVFNARYFDRTFLNELSLEDWIKAAEELQARLSDEAIDQALLDWEPEVLKLRGSEIKDKLISQRSNLQKYAIDIYTYLAKEVDIRGSNKKEYFKVERLDRDRTRVRVYKKTNENREGKLLYDRIFLKDETSEIRLYGLDGEDDFEINGTVNKGIKIRIIGGDNEDFIRDESQVLGLAKNTKVYDTKIGNTLELGTESKNLTSNQEDVNEYNRYQFKYNKLTPLVIGNINADDGLFIGGGFFFQSHGFRKDPFRSKQFLMGAVALATGAWQFQYNGHFTESIGPLDLLANLSVLAPNGTSNFFGIGNETVFVQDFSDTVIIDDPIDYYRTRYVAISAESLLMLKLSEKASLSFGFHGLAFDAEDDYNGEDRFILDNVDSISNRDIFRLRLFSGGAVRFEFDSRDNSALPNRGIFFETDIRGYNGLNDFSERYTRFTTSLALYKSLVPGTLVFATKFGGGMNFGAYEFYQAQILDGNTELRGYRKTRFFGRNKFYNNTELRLRIANFRNRIIPINVGFTVFNDVGRVWVNREESDKWHLGYGGGIWLAPLNVIVISLDIGHSEESTLAYFNIGYQF